MLFSIQAVIFLAMSALAQALPSAEPMPAVGTIDAESGLRVVEVTNHDDAVETWYGEVGDTPNPAQVLSRRADCLNYVATCNGDAGGSHLAPKSTCLKLKTKLANDGTKFPKSPRALCIKDKAGKCCVSWSKVPSTYRVLGKRALWSGVNAIYNVCGKDRKTISGRNTSAKVGTECMTVCLSNRKDGCK